jgi:hypothetical protein
LGGLGYNLWSGYQAQQRLNELQQQEAGYASNVAATAQAEQRAATPMLQLGEAMMTGGSFSGPVQAMLKRYGDQQRAAIIQGYAARNPGNNAAANPEMNSALQQDLANVDTNVLIMQEQIGSQFVNTANTLLAQGVSATEIAARLPMMMQELSIQLGQLTSNSMANFAAAMSGGTMRVAGQGTGGVNLNIGNNLSPFGTPTST